MPTFQSHDDTTIHFEIAGHGDPIVLLHSLGFNATLWPKMGVTAALQEVGRTTICVDVRGHGLSDAPHDPNRYGDNAMARDVRWLLDHLGFEQTDLVGYSMGSQIGLRVVQADPRIRRAVLAGLGDSVLSGAGPVPEPFCVMLESDIESIPLDARAFVDRLHRWGTDPRALAAMLRSRYVTVAPDLGRIAAKVLLLIGDSDHSMGDPHALAAAMPNAQVKTVPADHVTAMEHPKFAEEIINFLT